MILFYNHADNKRYIATKDLMGSLHYFEDISLEPVNSLYSELNYLSEELNSENINLNEMEKTEREFWYAEDSLYFYAGCGNKVLRYKKPFEPEAFMSDVIDYLRTGSIIYSEARNGFSIVDKEEVWGVKVLSQYKQLLAVYDENDDIECITVEEWNIPAELKKNKIKVWNSDLSDSEEYSLEE